MCGEKARQEIHKDAVYYLNNSWKQQPTKQQQYSYLSPPHYQQTIQVRHAGEIRTNSWTPTDGHTSDGWPVKIYDNSVWALGAIWRTCQEGWLIGIDGKKEPWESMMLAHLNDDEFDSDIQILKSKFFLI